MNIRFACVVVGLLLAAGTVWSQDRLGEVAGSIKLNPEAIVQKDGYVEDHRAALKEDRELYEDILSACLAAADGLGALIDETQSSMIYRGGELPNRLSAVSLELDNRLLELNRLRLSDVFAESAATARQAIESCNAGTDGVREELARKGLAFTLAREEIALCRQELHRAEAQLEAVGKTVEGVPTDATNAAEPVASITDEAVVEAACKSELGKGQDAVDACEGRQYRALAALGSRTAENELLDVAIFEEIRQICTGLSPSDFEARNLCEIERMTAARLGSE